MATNFSPVQAKDRVLVMDALRGFALLGIFIANVPGFNFNADENATGPLFTSIDGHVEFFDRMLIEGKFYTIFSLLFGWGIAVQLQRREDKGLPAISFARRRLGIMLLLGLAHIFLLWIGDIVAFYAMLGFVLLAMRKWKSKTLLILAALFILLPIPLYLLKMHYPVFVEPGRILQRTGIAVDKAVTGINSEEEFFALFSSMSYFDLVKLNVGGFFFRYSDLFFQSRIFKVLGVFLLGFLLGRNNYYKTLFQNRKLLWKVAIAGLIIGLPANFYMATQEMKDYYALSASGLKRTIAYAFGVVPLALGYVALFVLVTTGRKGKSILNILHPLGKMAFSNYIFQSLVATLFFMPFGLNMFGKMGALYMVLFAIAVYLLQIIISRIWIRYFQFGPVEWLWRSATYGKTQSFTKKKAQSRERVEEPTAV